MMSNFSKVTTVFILASLVFGAGCATTTTQLFTPMTDISKDEAAVYVYRQKNFFGSAVQFKVNIDGKQISSLPGGRYIAYVAAKGPLEVAAKTEIRSVVNIDVKPGETYYIRADIVPGAFVGNVILNQQSKELGAAQIAKCSLVPEKRQ
jgi:hypothetical protein